MNHAPLNHSKRTIVALLAIAATCPIAQGGDTGQLRTTTAEGSSLVGPSAVYGTQSGAIQREASRRVEQTKIAMDLLEEGRQAYKNGKYKDALDKFREAWDTLPDAPATAERRAFILVNICDASVAVAIEYAKVGRYDEAEQLLLDVLKYQPNNKRAQQELSFLRDPIRNNPALTPEHVKNVEEVNRLLVLAYGYYDLGNFNQAYDTFNRVLMIDPYNTAARQGQEAVNKRREMYYKQAHNSYRSKALADVEALWQETIPQDLPEYAAPTPGAPVDINVQKNEEALRGLRISNVSFEDTRLGEALDFLRGEARKVGQDINFITEAAAPVVVATGGEDEPPAPVATKNPEELNIDALKVSNISAMELLDLICSKTNCKYRIDAIGVRIVPPGGENNVLVTKKFTGVNRDFWLGLGGGDGATGEVDGGSPFDTGSSTSSASKVINAKEKLQANGINFPKGASASWNKNTGTLIVTNTQENLDNVDNMIEEAILNNADLMVEVTGKFVEIQQTNTDELSFDWVVNPFSINNSGTTYIGGTSGVGSNPIRSAGDFVGVPPNYTGTGTWPIGKGTSSGNQTGSATAQPINNGLMTGGLRSGTGATSSSSIDRLLASGSTSTSASTSVAPGIMSVSGIFNEGSYQAIMRGLSQKKGVDVMNAPSLLAKPGDLSFTPTALEGMDDDGGAAKIEVIRRFIYPSRYDPPQLQQQNNNNGGGWGGNGNNVTMNSPVATGATPSEWATEEVGVVLRFKIAEIKKDTGVIVFDRFEIKVVDFEGFVNYGSPITTAITNADGGFENITLSENRIEMPIFTRRYINTNPSIMDGHTLAIGGLLSENVQKVEDKVPIFGDLPLVGRFFRSNVDSHIKKNLMIFVTAKTVDPSGNSARAQRAGNSSPLPPIETATSVSSAPSLFAGDGLAPTP